MSMSAASERRFLSHEESEMVAASHYPAIADVDADRLRESRTQLRQLRDKSKTIARREQRAASGTGGVVEHAARRKQIFSQALKRTNRQIGRLEHAAAVARTAAGKRKALALKRRAEATQARPSAGRHPNPGMRPNPSLRRAMGVPGSQVGSVSQAGKAAQAKRDAAG